MYRKEAGTRGLSKSGQKNSGAGDEAWSHMTKVDVRITLRINKKSPETDLKENEGPKAQREEGGGGKIT